MIDEEREREKFEKVWPQIATKLSNVYDYNDVKVWSITGWLEAKKENEEEIEKRDKIIDQLVKKVRIYHGKYDLEFLGGRPFQFILLDIKALKEATDEGD